MLINVSIGVVLTHKEIAITNKIFLKSTAKYLMLKVILLINFTKHAACNHDWLLVSCIGITSGQATGKAKLVMHLGMNFLLTKCIFSSIFKKNAVFRVQREFSCFNLLTGMYSLKRFYLKL